jgi:ATP-dependent Clp protease ATP-binding subunit ClpC
VFERFTDRARRVVVLAQEEARLLNHNYIGTEHELLGLIHEEEGVGGRALEALGISLDAARHQVEGIIGVGQAAPTGHIPFTPRAKKVLELALRESRRLGHNYIGTEHILLGLIREGEGVGAQVLQNLGADLRSVRQAVLQILTGTPLAASEGLVAGLGQTSEEATSSGPRCPSCGLMLEGALKYRRLIAAPADEDDDEMPILMLFCGRCGAILRGFREGEGDQGTGESERPFEAQED